MSMLGNSPKNGFKGASNVRPKAQVGSGLINLNKLKGIQNRKKTGFESYKLNQNGLSRFRLIMPLGNDDTPMVSADQHWVPVTNDEGKVYKRPIYCYKQFGFSDCPICALQERLAAARDQAIVDSAEDLKMIFRWAAYVINRDYLAGSDDPEHEFDPRQDKVQLFSPISPKIADDIIAYLGKRTWGNASDPDNGYDFEVEGEQTGKVFNGYKVTDYTVSPVPKDCSPSYSIDILHGIKPLSEVVTYLKRQDLQKILDPILLSIAHDGEEAASIVEDFSSYYNQLLDEIVNGPSVVSEEYDDVELEQEKTVYKSASIEEDTDEDGGEDDAYNKAGVVSAQSESEESPVEGPEDTAGEDDGDGEGEEDSAEVGAEGEDIDTPVVAKPAPAVRPKPAGPLPAARPASKPAAANTGLLGKLKQVGQRNK